MSYNARRLKGISNSVQAGLQSAALIATARRAEEKQRKREEKPAQRTAERGLQKEGQLEDEKA
jgi:hypothetical protein